MVLQQEIQSKSLKSKELEEKMKNLKSVREKEIKEAEAELKRIKKKSDESRKNWKQRENVSKLCCVFRSARNYR